ncbi:chaperonin GroES [Candidatus Carsonella ruddii CS isolate Thao2000]|uniref:10 kDa chaperonin n=1 Tax=Candidatus Carsonella ruddii CS isolate Thao2000 TaxID=1202537 RepID=J7GT82_CARRU|nr:co-chaperone GroES family protein [Candidatus Carsonella ruddii]AFP83724.1 chaperonin GroES [Candidatus Carsonella ruddii CS isolate Thao2000]
MIFFPLYDKIVVKKINLENKIGKIYIPTNDNEIIKGEVIEVGIGYLLNDGNIKPLIVKKKDNIIFKDNYNIEKYKINNIEYYFIKEKDIISIIK